MSDWAVLQGDCVWWLRELPAESIDAVVTDPPYGIGFMGHAWDQPGEHGLVRGNGTPQPFGDPSRPRELERAMRRAQRRGGHHAGTGYDTRPGDNGAFEAGRYDFSPQANHRFQAWCEAWGHELLRVLKPGGHLVAFGGTRTYHRLVAGLEDAGFEIRDQLAWLFGSGFPKSRDLGDGVGTALKPGHEPIVLARRPCRGGPVSRNHAELGTGGLNIDACRLPAAGDYVENCPGSRGAPVDTRGRATTHFSMGAGQAHDRGRWPANVAMDPDAAAMLDDQVGELRSGANPTRRNSDKFGTVYGDFPGQTECAPARGADVGGPSRFYYCAKTSRAERNAGLNGWDAEALMWSNGTENPGSFQSSGPAEHANHHPTVKPIDLMRWLVRLIVPVDGVVLDLFTGSGTTGCAAVLEGRDFVGIEREPLYVQIAEARIAWWARHGLEAIRAERERPPAPLAGQMSIEDVA